MIGKLLNFSTVLLTAANAAFNQPSFSGCNVRFSWQNMDGPIELMSKEGKFSELT